MPRPLLVIGLTIVFLLAALGACAEAAGKAGRLFQASAAETSTDLSFKPTSYVVYRTSAPVGVDGRIDEATWTSVPWTADFVDISGRDQPAPRFRTRAKVLWDDAALYIAAYLEEPDVWATLTKRDTTIYQDNAFEVFIDPDGDTHNYYEIEVNALGTVWDLLVVKPYRDGGPALSAWDVRGLEVGVQVDGTLGDPTDTDEGWTLELALPWTALAEAAHEQRPPRAGEQWRLNFARPQWRTTVVGGAYEKEIDEATGRPRANWWVWSPQGTVNMHKPEWWGYVQFSANQIGERTSPFVEDPNERVKWALRQLYYRQRDYHDTHGHYAADLAELQARDVAVEGFAFEPKLQTTQSTYEITAAGVGGVTVHIRSDGKVWTSVD